MDSMEKMSYICAALVIPKDYTHCFHFYKKKGAWKATISNDCP